MGPNHLGSARRHLAAKHAPELINTCMDARLCDYRDDDDDE